jgi:hypothetical protein
VEIRIKVNAVTGCKLLPLVIMGWKIKKATAAILGLAAVVADAVIIATTIRMTVCKIIISLAKTIMQCTESILFIGISAIKKHMARIKVAVLTTVYSDMDTARMGRVVVTMGRI